MTWTRDRAELPRRAQRMLKIREAERDDAIAWARTIFAAMATAGDLERVRRLASLAIVGIEPGLRETGWLHELVGNRECHGFCKQCGKGFNGSTECLMEYYEPMCPRRYGDFADGVTPVAYAETRICAGAA